MQSDTVPNEFQGSGESGSGEPGGADRTGPRPAAADLEAQVSRLREDVAGVAESLKSLATGQAENARQQAYALRDDVRDRGERYFRQAQEAAGDLEEQLSERIRAEPVKSVLIAVAIGYVYARLFSR